MDTAMSAAGTVARGVGSAVVGPMIGAALDAPEVRAAVLRSALVVGASLAGGIALGLLVGRALGGGR